MFKCVCIAAVLLIVQPDSFHIYRTMVSADYGSIYILALANKIVPADKASRKSDVDCLVREAKKSGLFADVQARVKRGNKNSTEELLVNAKNVARLRDLTISEVVITGFDGVNKERFDAKLTEYDVKPGQILVKYSLNDLMERITNATKETVPDGAEQEDPWISIESAGVRTVKITVSPAFGGCR